MAPAEYVPAWRRIGLKLKSEEDGINGTAQPLSHTQGSVPKKRKLEKAFGGSGSHINDNETSTKKPKERKKGKNGVHIANEAITALSVLPTNGSKPKFTSPEANQPSVSRRKSVTFSPDTKISDGDTAKSLPAQLQSSRLARSGGIGEADIKAADKELNSIPPALTTNGTLKPSRAKRGKNPKKPKSGKDATASSTSGASSTWAAKDSVLDYLNTYHTSRSTWNFKKAKQVKLFKHIFDPTLVPFSYDDALYAYLASVQGDSIRDKLLDDGESVIKRSGKEKTEESGKSSEGKADTEEDATQELEEERIKRLDRIKRAETVVKAVRAGFAKFPRKEPKVNKERAAMMDAQGMIEKDSTRKEAGNAAPRKKKQAVRSPARTRRKRVRNRRTEIGSESGSSSSSDSESSSESEDEGGGMGGVKLPLRSSTSVVNGPAKRGKTRDGSESSSSSSASDSDESEATSESSDSE